MTTLSFPCYLYKSIATGNNTNFYLFGENHVSTGHNSVCAVCSTGGTLKGIGVNLVLQGAASSISFRVCKNGVVENAPSVGYVDGETGQRYSAGDVSLSAGDTISVNFKYVGGVAGEYVQAYIALDFL